MKTVKEIKSLDIQYYISNAEKYKFFDSITKQNLLMNILKLFIDDSVKNNSGVFTFFKLYSNKDLRNEISAFCNDITIYFTSLDEEFKKDVENPEKLEIINKSFAITYKQRIKNIESYLKNDTTTKSFKIQTIHDFLYNNGSLKTIYDKNLLGEENQINIVTLGILLQDMDEMHKYIIKIKDNICMNIINFELFFKLLFDLFEMNLKQFNIILEILLIWKPKDIVGNLNILKSTQIMELNKKSNSNFNYFLKNIINI